MRVFKPELLRRHLKSYSRTLHGSHPLRRIPFRRMYWGFGEAGFGETGFGEAGWNRHVCIIIKTISRYFRFQYGLVETRFRLQWCPYFFVMRRVIKLGSGNNKCDAYVMGSTRFAEFRFTGSRFAESLFASRWK